MFDRFSEKARRSIFFARYEASSFATGSIETEHLLLGLLRENRGLLDPAALEAVRQRVEKRMSTTEAKLSTSQDLPLSHERRRALSYAAEDAEAFGHRTIEPEHLLLGLLRIEECLATELLGEFGIVYFRFKETVRKMPLRQPPPPTVFPTPKVDEPEMEPALPEPIAPSLLAAVRRLRSLVEASQPHLEAFSDADGEFRLKRKSWSRKEAIGHLIDWASTHHQWLARALTEPKLTAAGYPSDEWVSAQQYRDARLTHLVPLWVRLNNLLLHVLAHVPEEKLGMPCRVGIEEPEVLLKLVERYVDHCEDLVAQVLLRAE